jgi:hypothetical protein
MAHSIEGWSLQGLSLGAAAMCATLLGATPALAQPRFQSGQVAVINASNFIEDYHSGDYTYGSPLAMTVQDEALARWRGKRIQARVFVLEASGSDRPASWESLADCDIFYTFVIEIGRVAANGMLNMGSVNALGWMRMPDGNLARGRFLVVFENATDDNAIFRLSRSDRASYFSRGLIISATHRNTAPRAPSSRWLASDERRVRRELAELSSDKTCYRFRIAENGEVWNEQWAQLQRCSSLPQSAAGTKTGERQPG